MDVRELDDHETFRNELASVQRDGRRRWIYARQPSGPLYRWRTLVSVVLLAFLFLAPFVRVDGQPLMMLNILERHFVLLGVVFHPQDFYLVVLIALAVLVTLVLSTVVVGRVWCGWLCPQTIFMEMLFRKIEYWIDGSAEQQIRRARQPRTAATTARQAVKLGIFFALSFLIANVFLAWVIGAPALRAIVTDAPRHHLAGLTAILIFTTVFFLVFTRFREQACVLACPYGRMMSSLMDAQTRTVTYDTGRGEPRGKRTARGGAAGDCIDCHRCVTVCPTGIDIRNGIQLECVSCTACIDACNDVMARTGRAPGLIRYTSAEAVRSGEHRWLSTRARAYSAVWLLLVAVVVTLLVRRPALDVLVLRQPGSLYVTLPGGDVGNLYTVQALNRTSREAGFEVDILEPRGATLTPLGPVGRISPHGVLDGRFLLRVPRAALAGTSTPVHGVIRSNGRVIHTIDTTFLGPTPAAPPHDAEGPRR
jgi:cytochrome c oxidase accessory protein FixG